ncbi:MAG: D-alanine--D-alanine ligase [Bacilli bacterium]|nr:D-alanine--D-alanine ligase [Bacilli bacterium]
MKLKIGVIFGGKSVEHEVSIISAIQAINNIDKDKYNIVPIYISKEKELYTGKNLLKIENYKDLQEIKKVSKAVTLCKINNEFCLLSLTGLRKVVDKIDVAFPIVHGAGVEDGSLAGYLDTIGVPYVGSRVLGSALGQDKVILKYVLKANDIPVTDFVWFYDSEYLVSKDTYLKQIKEMGYPVVVKPASLGSSVGITYVKDEDSIDKAIEEAFEYDRKILVEKAVDNLVEVNCSVLGNYHHQEVSILEEVISSSDILTYQDKYIGHRKMKGPSKGMVNTDRRIPANIDECLQKEIKDLSILTFKALNLSGVCRIDYLIDSKKNKVYVNEPNIIPGSLSFYLWEPIGKKYQELLDDLIKQAIDEYKISNKKVSHFQTNILENFEGTKGIKK